MKLRNIIIILLFLLFSGSIRKADAQVLTLKDAIQTALTNYGTIKAKAEYLNASKATVKQAKRDYLPNVSISAEQNYGTVNGQYGPLYGFSGLEVSSSGPVTGVNSWNAAFGGLYLTNVNWDFFAFGRAKDKISVAQSAVVRDEADWQQEQFQQEIRVTGVYLNLLAAQRLIVSWQKNLDRADTLRAVTVLRAKNGLIPGVDSSEANAEVSNAKIALTQAIDAEQVQANELALLMGIPPADFVTDTLFISHLPIDINTATAISIQDHPVLKYYKSRIDFSNQQVKYFRTFNYPTFSFFGVYQDKASGFYADYLQNPGAFTGNYGTGVNPTISNYLLGVGVTWNLTDPLRVSKQVAAQIYTSKGLQDEYDLMYQQEKDQLILSDTKITNAINNYKEAPIQVKAASDAYTQRTVLYKHGLNNIVDLTQALYTLNRAEIDMDIAYTNVWQALLLKAAASGDFKIFIDNF